MLFDFANVLVFLLFGVGFAFVCMLLVRFLAPRAATRLKSTPYECGEIPIGTPWIRFNSRYYVYALVFLIFDVEIVLVFPCAVVFRQWIAKGMGWLAFGEIFAFLSILLVGLIYVWKMGDLSWIRPKAQAVRTS